MMEPSENSPYPLLVEGRDDRYTIINLLRRHDYDWRDPSVERPFVRDCGGFDPLVRDLLPIVAKSCSRLGVVVDADMSCRSRWDSIRNAARSFGVAMPAEPEKSGAVLDEGPAPGFRFGVRLMPDNVQPGKLEDFIAKLVPPGDACWPLAQTATTEARSLGAPLKEAEQCKGEIHAWLAWQEDPGLPFGTALNARILGQESPEAAKFVAWFLMMFKA